MKIECRKQDLQNSINIVLRAVPGKSNLPILECIAMKAEGNRITFTTNDLELGIETLVKGSVSEEGNIAVNAKILSEIIRRLPEASVFLEADEYHNLTIFCEKTKLRIPGKPTDDFPVLPDIERNNALKLSQLLLKDIIRQTSFSISNSENNSVLAGELFELENNELKLASFDRFRLSVRRINLSNYYDKRKVVIPGKTLTEIGKILSDKPDDELRIYITDKHILFEFDNTTVLSRLIAGEYYAVSKLISLDYGTEVYVNKRRLLECIDLALLINRENPIIIRVINNSMKLIVNSSMGYMNEELDIKKDGNDILIAFDPKYLIDVLKVIEDDEIAIYFTTAKAPCVIRNPERSYIYLISPVVIKEEDYSEFT